VGFFSRRDDEDSDQARSPEQVERGGIPARAERRLQALGADASFFTSGLSVNEFALLRRLGPQPLAQVMGASVIRTGWQFLPALPPGQIVSYSSFPGGTYSSRPAGNVNAFTEPPSLRSATTGGTRPRCASSTC
jgi:hypothetical protein